MKKLYSLLFLLVLSVGLLSGCGEATKSDNNSGKEKAKTEQAAFPVTIKDGIGEEVVIDKKPEKIVSLMPSNTEIAFGLDLGDKIVGVSDYDTYPEEATKKEKIGGQEFNVEKVISLKPDLVLAHASSANTAKDGLQQLRDAGIAVLVVNNADNFDQVYQAMEMIGTATGESDKAKEMVQGIKDKLTDIQTKAATIKEKKTVYIEVSPQPDIYTTGKNTFMNEMLQVVNAENAAGDSEGWIKVDEEAMIAKNPDVIVTTYGYYVKEPASQIMKRKGWLDVNAIKNKQVVDVNADLVNRPGPRIAEGVEELAKAIYPEVFK